MDNKKILWGAFVLMALVQLYSPAKMILDQEKILESGKEFRFKTAPIDPNDPFRGKYITLRFEETEFEVLEEENWQSGDDVYVLFTTDNDGFVKIKSVSKTLPIESPHFLKTKVDYATSNGSNKLIIEYPFNRYYMQEYKAAPAEQVYQESRIDTTQIVYALVNVMNGEAVLKDVVIDGVSIKDLVKDEKD